MHFECVYTPPRVDTVHVCSPRGLLLRCDNWQVDLDEHIHSRINQSISTDCRMFRPRRPLSTALELPNRS